MLKKIFVVMVALCSVAMAGKHWGADNVTMKFLAMSASAKAAALSGAGVVSPSRVSEVSRNPLASSVADTAEFGLSQIVFGEGVADNYSALYYGMPIGEHFSASLSAEFLGYKDLQGYDEDGMETSEYGAYAWTFLLGLGSRNDVFNWGVSGRYAYQSIDDEAGYMIVGNIGGSYKVNEHLVFGAVLTDAGYASEYMDESNYPPMALQAGVTAIIPFHGSWKFKASADAYRRTDSENQWLLGGELSFYEILTLRIGYAFRSEADDNTVSCGVGLAFSMIVFDYSYQPHPELDAANHYFSVGLKF